MEMNFVCPRCNRALSSSDDSYSCSPCRQVYPVVCGIPDFRVNPDPYITPSEDRNRAELLAEWGRERTYAELLDRYFSLAPDVPPDLAKRWTDHKLADIEIAKLDLRATLGGNGLASDGALLDVGCSSGGLLAAAHANFQMSVGVDVALRWLVIARLRLRMMGVRPQLVCANAEYLPFADRVFHLVTAVDVLEHVGDAQAAVSEARRVSASGAKTLCLTNNRYAPIRDPQIGVWGVGYLPRSLQSRYAVARRADVGSYRVAMRSGPELERLFGRAGYQDIRLTPAGLYAPHLGSRVLHVVMRVYNRLRRLLVLRSFLTWLGPRLSVTATRRLD